jgi:hypothetical protein
MTDVRVKLNGVWRPAAIIFAEPRDLGFIDVWRDKLGDDTDTVRRDALDLAQLAIDSFLAHSRVQQLYANSIEELAAHIKADEQCEVACFVLMKCNWFPDSEVLGICHFRRSWCNSIVLDYLATYPFAARPPEGYPHVVGGVGTALLWLVSDIARQFSCGRIWGEATRGSRSYYKDRFELDSVEDLILVLPDNYTVCAKRELRWRDEGDPNTMNAELAEKLYKAEAENPPLIGRRSFVVSPSRKLAYDFLDLPRHVQMQIARAFGLPKEGDEGLRDAYLFRALFRLATETGKLADLWNEVETKHPKGRPEENPFR